MSAPIAVAVVSWNTRDLLARCLRSLAPDHEDGTAGVWVVDNASTDGSPEMVAEEFDWVSLIASEQNLGFGPAVNLVARQARGAWIAPANADIEVFPGALDALLEAGRRDHAAGLIAPRLVLPDGSTQHSVHSFPTVGKALVQAVGVEGRSPALAERLCMVGHWNPDRGRRVDWAHGAFLLARPEAWEAVDGFDDDQWMYAEDIDIAWRMRRAGWVSRYEPTAHVRHAVSAATTQAFGDERERRSMRAMYEWSTRRRGLVPTWGTAAVNTAATGARAVFTRGAERNRWRWHMEMHALGLRRRAKLLDR